MRYCNKNRLFCDLEIATKKGRWKWLKSADVILTMCISYILRFYIDFSTSLKIWLNQITPLCVWISKGLTLDGCPKLFNFLMSWIRACLYTRCATNLWSDLNHWFSLWVRSQIIFPTFWIYLKSRITSLIKHLQINVMNLIWDLLCETSKINLSDHRSQFLWEKTTLEGGWVGNKKYRHSVIQRIFNFCFVMVTYWIPSKPLSVDFWGACCWREKLQTKTLQWTSFLCVSWFTGPPAALCHSAPSLPLAISSNGCWKPLLWPLWNLAPL